MTTAELLIPEFDREMARTRKVLENVPSDGLGWKAHESTHTVGWNANHLAEIVGWAPMILHQDEFDMAPVDGPRYETPTLDDPMAIVASFEGNVAKARSAIETVSDATLSEDWSMKAGGDVLFTITKGECLRTWVFNHTIHHRAILSLYLRMLGVELVPVYDE